MRAIGLLWIFALAGCGGATPPADDGPATAPPAREAPPTPSIDGRAAAVHARFSPERALAVTAYADRYFRVRGNEGYVKTLERVRDTLREAGLDPVTMPALGPVEPTWTPRSATLTALGVDGEERLVHFASEAEVDRAALLVGSDSFGPAEVEVIRADAVARGEDATGRVVLAEGSPGRRFAELVAPTGAVGLLTMNLEPYHQTDAHPDMAQFGYLPDHEGTAFGFSLSRRDHAAMEGITRVRVHVDVAVSESAAVAVDARIEGTDPSAGAIVFVAHVDEPGANDNASGVGALTELAVALHSAIEAGEVARPRRTLVFLWGQEIEVSHAWLAAPPVPVAAGLVMDMVGEDPDAVGAPFLIERMPDPGAIWLRAPDAHTEWGATEVSEDRLRGHFLNDLMAASASSVARLDGPWDWRTNPFEGGSDHVPFLERGLPSVLGWHFTDGAYHTTVDRMGRVSGEEMRRVAATFGAAALTMAGDDRAELDAILDHAEATRLRELEIASAALIAAGDSDEATEAHVRAAWRAWYAQARETARAWPSR